MGLIVVLGVFVFPALLGRPVGRWIVAVATAALMGLFFVFDRGSGLSTNPLVPAIVIGLAPLLAAGVVYRTDALADPGVAILGTFPADSHSPIVYPLALAAASTHPGAAAFADFLMSPQARAIFTRDGFAPPP